jgi:hypothetical protein
LKNKFDEDEMSNPPSPSSAPLVSSSEGGVGRRLGGFCADGVQMRLRLDERHHFMLIPLVHDTLAARMHLLYTSYFLFTTLVLLLVYAMCKGHQFHPKSQFLRHSDIMDESSLNGKGVS